MISKGVDYWSDGFWRACRDGYLDIVETMISKSDEELDWDAGLMDTYRCVQGANLRSETSSVCCGATKEASGQITKKLSC